MNCSMTKLYLSLSLCLISVVASAQDEGQATAGQQPGLAPNATVTATVDNASLVQKSSYIIGFNTTKQLLDDLKQQGIEFDMDKMTEGMHKAIKGDEIGMTDEEIRSVMLAFQKVVEKQQVETMTREANQNRTAGETFMVGNGKKEGVKMLDNGVQYEVLTAGDGPSPSEEDVVKIHYHGTLPNGEVFDSSLHPADGSPAEPVEFPVARVVPGFSAALQAMKVGDKWKVVIPGELAYGVHGQGEIGPNQTLVFEIELLDIVK